MNHIIFNMNQQLSQLITNKFFSKDDQLRFIHAMGETELDRFYVYMLCTKDGIPFYIGKGQGTRIFDHMKHASNIKLYSDIELTPKIQTLLAEGNEYIPKIVKYGLTEKEAYIVESAVINCATDILKTINKPVLTNLVNGHATLREKNSHANLKTQAITIDTFLTECAPPLVDIEDLASYKIAFITLGYNFYSKCKNLDGTLDLFKIGECARGFWRIGQKNGKAFQVKYIFVLHKMQIIGIFNVKRTPMSIADERKNGLQEFPTFPEDVRRFDYIRCAFSSLKDVQQNLSKKEYYDFISTFKVDITQYSALEDNYLKFQKSRIYFCINNDIPEDILKYKNYILISNKLKDKFSNKFQRNPVYLNF